VSNPRPIEIRRYTPADRARVRELCCATGCLGNPIAPVFEDLELFADYLTAYYTDWEPESAFVVLVNGEICGYLLGARRWFLQGCHGVFQTLSLLLRGIARYPRYNPASKKFVHWILRQARREVPEAPRRMAHFHINLLPEARRVATTRALVEGFLDHLRQRGEQAVYGQMVVFEDRRGAKLFERYGFRVLNKAEITKYRDVYPAPVYLCTVTKDLRGSS
jgi:ribosomal protein S18 acetylase RimI-like enzyme